jgi:hypothetical protein
MCPAEWRTEWCAGVPIKTQARWSPEAMLSLRRRVVSHKPYLRDDMSYPGLARDADDTSMYNNEPRDRNFDLIRPVLSFYSSQYNSALCFLWNFFSARRLKKQRTRIPFIQHLLIKMLTLEALHVTDFAHDVITTPNTTTVHANPVVLVATWFSSLGMIAKELAWPMLVTRDAANAHARFKQIQGLRNFVADVGFKQASRLSLVKRTRHYSW